MPTPLIDHFTPPRAAELPAALLPLPGDRLVRMPVNARAQSFPATIQETSSCPLGGSYPELNTDRAGKPLQGSPLHGLSFHAAAHEQAPGRANAADAIFYIARRPSRLARQQKKRQHEPSKSGCTARLAIRTLFHPFRSCHDKLAMHRGYPWQCHRVRHAAVRQNSLDRISGRSHRLRSAGKHASEHGRPPDQPLLRSARNKFTPFATNATCSERSSNAHSHCEDVTT